MQHQHMLEVQHGTAQRNSSRKGGRALRNRWQRQALLPYLFLAPFLVLFVLFFLLPLLYALGISVFVDRLIGGTVFAGGQNYLAVFQDADFWDGVRRMLLFMVVQVPVMLGLALIFALLLDSGLPWLRTLFRLGFFLPYAIPEVVAALTWGYLYGPDFGLFAQIAHAFHSASPGFLTSSGILASIGNVVTWQYTGYNMIIMYTALKAIPSELYESARIDGASGWKVAWYLKIPLIAPALMLTSIFSIIGSLQLFSIPQILATIAPDVIGNHFTPNFYAYTLAFTNQQYNYSAAVSFTLGAVVFVCSYIFMFLTNRKGMR
jgi:multiple sugar transport system permease protein